ncbi:hypothetical protein [Spirosoma pulveris]
MLDEPHRFVPVVIRLLHVDRFQKQPHFMQQTYPHGALIRIESSFCSLSKRD